MATHQTTAPGEASPYRHATGGPPRPAGDHRHTVRLLTGRDLRMGRILAAMAAFGALVGVVYPFVVSPLVTPQPGREAAFRAACIVAGLLVGGFAYGVARFTLYRANLVLAGLAAYDDLTGLFNQRQFPRSLSAELQRADRNGEPVSLVIADLDCFKHVNDTHGHPVGDAVLAAVAADIAASVRPFDVACRLGGEEFAVILPQTGKEEALAVAERIRSRVAHADRGDLPEVTISCGVATYPDDARSPRTLAKRADDAMYAAKAAGRNAVRAWRPPVPREDPAADPAGETLVG